ncbi:MAG: isoaspartyl peptidase/L-asparaginase [Cyanobacteria bacterium J06659_2]
MQPKLIIHGGAGSSLKGGRAAVRQDLYDIVEAVYARLMAGASAKAAVVYGCQLLEANPRFNAGKGSVLQSDGQVRMSAALMDGVTQRFSGVINVSRVEHPIELAEFLQAADDRVLSDHGAADLARELQLPIYDPLTDLRIQEWIQERAGNFQKAMAGVVAENGSPEGGSPENGLPERDGARSNARRGTIGVVALDQTGQIVAGTSTGGKGLERIGRVSDSAMPAGNYAMAEAGVSCTGVGEDIIDECLAAKIVIRVVDGASLGQSMEKSFTEASQHQRDLGAIAIDKTGAIAWGKTSEVLLAAYHDGYQMGDSLDADVAPQTVVI